MMKRNPDIFAELGILALVSRLRRLTETMTAEGEALYEGLGVAFRPRWFPAFYALNRRSPLAVGELAGILGMTHTAVAKLANEMIRGGLVRIAPDTRRDRRRRLYSPTAEGRRMFVRLGPVWREIGRAAGEISAEAGVDLIADVGRFERAFARRSVVDRVQKRLNLPPRHRIEIVDYRPAYKKHFRSLNEQWLREHFFVEEEDAKLLDDPMGLIVRRGGAVLFALYDGEIAGTCAIMRHRSGPLELCKMAVRPELRRRGVGEALMEAAVDRARAMGARELHLFTSLKLGAAMRLYRRAGFKRIARGPLGPCRLRRECIPMRLKLDTEKGRKTP